MNNQGYQQPNYPPQQPYPGPGGYPYPPKKAMDISGFIAKMASVLSFVFFILAGVACLYGLIMSIVCAASDNTTFSAVASFVARNSKTGEIKGFGEFMNGFAWTIGVTAKYLFYAGVLSILNKLAKK